MDFPSGSHWGESELTALAFPLEPQGHEFDDLSLDHDIRDENLDVLDILRIGFGVKESEWRHGTVPIGFDHFYGSCWTIMR